MFLSEMGCMGCGRMGRLGIDPLTASAAITAGSGLIETVAGWFGATTAKDITAKQIKAAQQESKRQAALQEQLLRAQASQVQEMARTRDEQLAYEAAMKQRSQQLTALYAVGGVALLVSGYFIIQAMRKKGK
jgi:predicted amino acid dehydrogenase